MKDSLSRRDFFKRAGVGAIGLGFGVSLFDGIYQYAEAATEEEKHALLMKGSVNFMGFMAKEITPNNEFYVTTYSDTVPTIDPKRFSLRVDSIPYSLSLSEDVFIAFKMNGEPLPEKHGYPLRAIVPGIYGMKHVKWLSKIELVNYDFKGYWEKRGWSDDAIIPDKSQILMPMDGKTIPLGHYFIGGVAFAGRYGISKVQISLDNKRTWHDAELKPPLSKWSWTLWSYNWKPSQAAEYTITVRGIDRAGKVQESPSLLGMLFRSFPDGAKGLHSVRVQVSK
jgi:hypothetical protein